MDFVLLLEIDATDVEGEVGLIFLIIGSSTEIFKTLKNQFQKKCKNNFYFILFLIHLLLSILRTSSLV